MAVLLGHPIIPIKHVSPRGFKYPGRSTEQISSLFLLPPYLASTSLISILLVCYHGVFASSSQAICKSHGYIDPYSCLTCWTRNHTLFFSATLHSTELKSCDNQASTIKLRHLNYPLTTTLPSWKMASLPPSTTDVNTETIVVASCLGGGLLLATALIATIMIVKRRARLRKLQEKDLKMEATKAWAREVWWWNHR